MVQAQPIATKLATLPQTEIGLYEARDTSANKPSKMGRAELFVFQRARTANEEAS